MLKILKRKNDKGGGNPEIPAYLVNMIDLQSIGGWNFLPSVQQGVNIYGASDEPSTLRHSDILAQR